MIIKTLINHKGPSLVWPAVSASAGNRASCNHSSFQQIPCQMSSTVIIMFGLNLRKCFIVTLQIN